MLGAFYNIGAHNNFMHRKAVTRSWDLQLRKSVLNIPKVNWTETLICYLLKYWEVAIRGCIYSEES